ncbi:MAG: DUF4129 domain-containing protein [Chloroflexi bacterium]|nr:DUF4129 domain-containing protein [Chloroflexota bacterium]
MIATLAVIGAIAAEALALYTFAELLGAGFDPGQHAISGISFVAVALIAFAIPRAVQFVAGSGARAYAAAIGLVAVLWYAVLRLEFAGDLALWDFGWLADIVSDSRAASKGNGDVVVGAMFLFALCARSTFRSAAEVDMELMARYVGFPFVAVTIMVVIGATTDNAGAIARGGAGFYAVAVLTLALSQLALSGATIGTLRAGGITGALLGGTLAATIGCVVVFGLIFGIVAPALGPPVGAVVEKVLTVVLTPPAWLLEKLFRALFSGSNPFNRVQLTQFVTENAGRANDGPQDRESPWSKFGAMAFRILALALVAAIATGILFLVMALRRRLQPQAAAGPSASTSGSFRDDAGAFMRRLFSRNRTAGYGAPSSEAVRLYRDVLSRAESRGYPRAAAETAEEFLPKLHTAFETSVTDDITAAFEQARYAGREPDAATLADLRRRWQSATGSR